MGAAEENSTASGDSCETMARGVSILLGERFEWSVRPCSEDALRGFSGGFVILVTGGAVGVFAKACGASTIEMVFWGVAAVVILSTSLSSFFLRSKYIVDPEGITAKYPLRTKRMKWADVRRFVRDDRGGFLSTRAKASRMDAYRGMHLRFDGDGRAIVERIDGILKGRKAGD